MQDSRLPPEYLALVTACRKQNTTKNQDTTQNERSKGASGLSAPRSPARRTYTLLTNRAAPPVGRENVALHLGRCLKWKRAGVGERHTEGSGRQQWPEAARSQPQHRLLLCQPRASATGERTSPRGPAAGRRRPRCTSCCAARCCKGPRQSGKGGGRTRAAALPTDPTPSGKRRDSASPASRGAPPARLSLGTANHRLQDLHAAPGASGWATGAALLLPSPLRPSSLRAAAWAVAADWRRAHFCGRAPRTVTSGLCRSFVSYTFGVE